MKDIQELSLKYALNDLFSNGAFEDQKTQLECLEIVRNQGLGYEPAGDYINIFGVHLAEPYEDFSVGMVMDFVNSQKNNYIRFAEDLVKVDS